MTYQLSKQTSMYFDPKTPVSMTAIRPFSLSSSQSAAGASPIAVKTRSLRYPPTSTFPLTSTFPANWPAQPPAGATRPSDWMLVVAAFAGAAILGFGLLLGWLIWG